MQHGNGVINFQLSGDKKKAAKYLPQGRILALSLLERLKLGEIESGSTFQELEDGRVICRAIVSMTSTVVVRIHALADSEEIEDPRFIRLALPDFVSGVAEAGDIQKGFMYQFNATTLTKKKYELPGGWIGMDRLAVEQWTGTIDTADYTEFSYDTSPARATMDSGAAWWVGGGSGGSAGDTAGDDGSTFTESLAFSVSEYTNPSQYAKIKPTFWSGTMRQAVQSLMGFGKYTQDPIYNWTEYDDDPDSVPYVSVYEQEVFRNGRQIRFDYKFYRTHGLTKAEDGKWWLVEISARGITAMPLMLHKSSTTQRFKDYLSDTGDYEALAVVEMFGGFPTGQTFPSIPDEKEQGVKAGIILKLAEAADMKDFYTKSYYSPVMGWAFSESGGKADNTCYTYDSTLRMTGHHFSVSISIGSSREIKKTSQRNTLITMLKMQTVSSKGEMDMLAIKCENMTVQQGSQVIGSENFLDTLRGITVAPLASGSASMIEVDSGYLWTQPSKQAVSLLKFYDPAILHGAVVSHMMKPLPGFKGGAPECDTTVFVFYDGETLKKGKFFHSNKTIESYSDGEAPHCLAGRWTLTSGSGGGRPMGNFYTTDIDTREEAHPNSTVTTGSASKAGFQIVTVVDDPTDIRQGVISRFRRIHSSNSFSSRSGYFLVNSLVWPGWDREAYYYATRRYESSSSSGGGSSSVDIEDTNFATYYRTIYPDKDGVINIGYYSQPHPKCGDEQPTRRVWELKHVGGGECESIATDGAWLSECQGVDDAARAEPLPIATQTSKHSGAKSDYDVVLYMSKIGLVECKTGEKLDVSEHFVETPWERNSPTPEGKFQFLFATRNCMGETLAARYDKDINAGQDDIGLKELSGERYKQNICFVGVY